MAPLFGGHLQQRGGARVVGQVKSGVRVARRAVVIGIACGRRQRRDRPIEIGKARLESLSSFLRVHSLHRYPSDLPLPPLRNFRRYKQYHHRGRFTTQAARFLRPA